MFIWLIILILIVIYIFGNNSSKYNLSQRETSLDILKKRYARGEISKEEFDNIKKDLE